MVERKYHIIDQKKKRKKKIWEGRTETDCTTKGISVQKIMPAPFLHMLVCLLACLLAVGNNDLFFSFIVGYESGSESESEMRYPFFSF